MKTVPFPKFGELVEVRCCCDVDRVLGYVKYLGPAPTYAVELDQEVAENIFVEEEPTPQFLKRIVIQLEYCSFWTSQHKKGWAYKSSDYPIEDLRKIPGWIDSEDDSEVTL